MTGCCDFGGTGNTQSDHQKKSKSTNIMRYTAKLPANTSHLLQTGINHWRDTIIRLPDYLRDFRIWVVL